MKQSITFKHSTSLHAKGFQHLFLYSLVVTHVMTIRSLPYQHISCILYTSLIHWVLVVPFSQLKKIYIFPLSYKASATITTQEDFWGCLHCNTFCVPTRNYLSLVSLSDVWSTDIDLTELEAEPILLKKFIWLYMSVLQSNLKKEMGNY